MNRVTLILILAEAHKLTAQDKVIVLAKDILIKLTALKATFASGKSLV